MADFNALEALINAHIKKNGVQAITGNILNGILRGMVSALGKGYTIAGVAVPSSDPGTMTGPLAYLAYTAGTYTHFGGLEVEQGEVAMLIYNEAVWHKEVLFSLAASATIDGNVGTPEVGVSFVDGLLTFDFRNMKGNPGDAAGFGTINATVDGNVGTPGVSVESSGPDTAKNITFQFTNLKGETGVTSVVATVDNTVGTPTCTVSLVGQQLTLAFSGLKGAQGDTGSSVDYPFTIVNNLTTNDATQALSAAMGVQLEAEVSQLEAKVDDIDARVFGSSLDLTQNIVQTYDDNGTWYSGGANYTGIFFPLPPGCKIAVKVGVAQTQLSFLTAKTTSGAVPYATLGHQTIANSDHTEHLYETDENTKYLWVGTKAGSNNLTPTYVKILSSLPDYSKYFLSVPKSQLFDRTQVETGYCDLTGYVNTGSTGYVHTQKIDVSNYIGRTIYFSANGNLLTSLSFRFITVYNASGVAQQSLGIAASDQKTSTFVVPEGAASIVITYTAPNGNNNMDKFQAEFDKVTAFSAYELVTELSYPLIDRNVQYHIDKAVSQIESGENVLKGKKWVACGDSFTHGDFTNAPENDYTIEEGQYQGFYKVYPYLIGNRNGMTIVNEAVNGSTMTYIDGTKSEFSKVGGRYTQIPEDADYITLKFGINDDSAHQNVPIGTINDNTNETFYGAWNIVLDYIIQNHIQAKIGIIITNGATLDIVNATIAIAEKWGLPYLNEATDKQCSFMFRSNRTDVVSSVRSARNTHWYVSNTPGQENAHPNALAHEYESTVIEAWLRTL